MPQHLVLSSWLASLNKSEKGTEEIRTLSLCGISRKTWRLLGEERDETDEAFRSALRDCELLERALVWLEDELEGGSDEDDVEGEKKVREMKLRMEMRSGRFLRSLEVTDDCATEVTDLRRLFSDWEDTTRWLRFFWDSDIPVNK